MAAVLLGIFAFVSIPLVGLSLSNIRVFQVLESASTLLDPAEPGQRDVTFILSKGMQAVLAVGDQFSNPVRIIGLVAAVACLIWLYRVHSNLPALGARNLEFTPEWAVGWWFIPIFHLFRPYQVVREIWQASDPGVSREDQTLEVGPSNALLGWWWALVVSGLVLAFYYPFWAKITEGTVFGVATTIDAEFYIIEATNAALNIAASVLGILVVLKMDDMQTTKHRQLAAEASAPSPPPPEAPPEAPGYEQG